MADGQDERGCSESNLRSRALPQTLINLLAWVGLRHNSRLDFIGRTLTANLCCIYLVTYNLVFDYTLDAHSEFEVMATYKE